MKKKRRVPPRLDYLRGKKRLKESYLKIRGFRIHYLYIDRQKTEVRGQRSEDRRQKTDIRKAKVKAPYPVILIHPFSGSLANWALNIHSLSRHFKIITFDLPGYGFSYFKGKEIKYNLSLFSEILIEVMENLKIKRASLVGSSLGGQVALSTAIRYPQKIHKLILVDSAGVTPFPLPLREAIKLGINFSSPFLPLLPPPKFVVKFLVNFCFHQPSKVSERLAQDIVEYLSKIDYLKWSKVLSQTFYTIIDEDLRRDVHKIKAPTLIIWGREDHLIWICDAYYLRNKIKDSKLVVLDKCGHFPQMEKPREFNQALINFLLEE